MQSVHDLKSHWASQVSCPWSNNNVVGSAEAAKVQLLKLLKQSTDVDANGNGGECISALLVGPRGAGKTFVVKSAISELQKEGNLIIPITLHGSICSDDKSSMRQIFSQFQQCLVGGSSTLDSLTRLTFSRGSLSEWVSRLSCLLQECARSDYMVVIVLEDFESFCHSKAKQSLLYNLFDLMHVPDIRFVVVGVTRKPDASEHLEKRIKSRFQLRKIVLSPPDSFEHLLHVIEAVLCPPHRPKTSSLLGTIRKTLQSKELKQQWSLYRDMGWTVRDFATAALAALITSEDTTYALINCCHTVAQKTCGDVGIMQTLLPALAVREHIVLIGLLKLHQDRKRPKCFAHILKEIESFEKRNSVAGTSRHSKRAYWHAFNGLANMGYIEIVDVPNPPPPMFRQCRLNIADSYWNHLRTKDTLKMLPQEVVDWANQVKNLET